MPCPLGMPCAGALAVKVPLVESIGLGELDGELVESSIELGASDGELTESYCGLAESDGESAESYCGLGELYWEPEESYGEPELESAEDGVACGAD